jgi:capsular polysaccharide biosynthesis protein
MKKILLYEKFRSERTKPKNLISDDNQLFEHEYEKNFGKIYYSVVKEALIINEFLYNLKELNLMSKYSYFSKPTFLRLIRDLYRNFFRSKSSQNLIEEGIWITDNKSSVYFHFLCDALTRYTVLPEEVKSNIPVLLPIKYKNSWIIEIFEFLKINYIIFEKNKKIRVKKLIIPSYTAPSGNFHRETLINLRESFIKSLDTRESMPTQSNKIWIDMSKHRRPVVNINQIRPILKKYNFIEVVFEDLSITEKLDLLKNTNLLVGSHSSGLTNMLFMNKNSKIIDIRDPRDNIKNAFFSMASELEIDYYYMERDNNSNQVNIDPDKLDSLIASIVGSSN